MKKSKQLLLAIFAITTFTFVSCSKEASKTVATVDQQTTATHTMISESGSNPDEAIMNATSSGGVEMTATNSAEEHQSHQGHYLYSESNEAGINQIYVYQVNHDGSLSWQSSTVSGGVGTGMGLGSEGALVLSDDHDWLFAVNAGSNSVSSFKVHNDGSLSLAHTENCRGKMPVSVSFHKNLLYVLNFASDNIHGFWVGDGGTLTHIEGSTKSLSGTGVVPPQISFTPNGNWLIVTEKATNNISSFKVKNDGSVWPDLVTASTGQTPFGFDFGRDDIVVVSNAAGGVPGAGSATSYRIGENGVPHDVNGAIPNDQGAPCWVATTKYGRFAFVSNTGSNTISSYYIGPGGHLFLVEKAAVTTGNSPADIVVAKNNFNVYELNTKSGSIGEYHRKFFGGLDPVGTVSGLPASTTGLTTY